MKVIHDLKTFLDNCFKLEDSGDLKYFLGLEIARSHKGISISQRHYALELLAYAGFLGCKPCSTPMEPGTKLLEEEGELLADPLQYRRLVGRLLYLTITRPDLSYAVNCVSQFMGKPRDSHLKAIHRILQYIKNSPGQGLFYSK